MNLVSDATTKTDQLPADALGRVYALLLEIAERHQNDDPELARLLKSDGDGQLPLPGLTVRATIGPPDKNSAARVDSTDRA